MAKRRAARLEVAPPQARATRFLLPVLVVLFCSVFGALGVYKTAQGLMEVTRGFGTMSWKEGVARVLEVKQVRQKLKRSRGRSRMVDAVHVRYQFDALGKSYEGNTIHLEYDLATPVEIHKSLYASLKAAHLVRVFYNDQHPEQNALCRGVDPVSIQKGCVGVFVLLFIAMILLVVVMDVTQRWDYSQGIVMLPPGARADGSQG
ncbi:DUF3592 domain-containing protein [Roseimicrobium sp. ORNL1]|uniref:DUF3592 domain-containing protein n=1 Tax=Roseimicrobium sp. ORNL1 TaxID=2711231 RepID=UPI0023F2FD26|nr:DUF3592 domain-containing protein [Roseimicrobium sp. ORNL1]